MIGIRLGISPAGNDTATVLHLIRPGDSVPVGSPSAPDTEEWTLEDCYEVLALTNRIADNLWGVLPYVGPPSCNLGGGPIAAPMSATRCRPAPGEGSPARAGLLRIAPQRTHVITADTHP